ncbi:MAG: hypothetical protein Q9220_006002 [cf. Caloplaca sp. 1 TL-2023]
MVRSLDTAAPDVLRQLDVHYPTCKTMTAIRQSHNATGNYFDGWPRPPWSYGGLSSNGHVEFEFYGRILRPTTRVTRLVDHGLAQLFGALESDFEPGDPREIWTFRQGGASFDIRLEPEYPVTKEAILEMFQCTWMLYDYYERGPAEVAGAVLFAQNAVRAFFSLTFPGIKQ